MATDIVGYDDDRQMCWATTSLDAALQWALQRGRHIGPILYVYEVALDDVLVDINVHRVGTLEDLTSVMSPHGRVVALVGQMHESEHPNAPSFGIRPMGR